MGLNSKFFVIGLAAALSSSAFASFDLLLQSDFDSTQGHHIDRYDPVSRTYLGSFSTTAAATAMAASVQRGLVAIVTSTVRVDFFNYSTGALVRSALITGPLRDVKFSADGNTLVALTSTGLSSINMNTWSNSTVTLSGVTDGGALELLSNGGFLVGDNGSQTWRTYSPTNLLTSSLSFVGHTTISSLARRVESGVSGSTYRGADGTGSLRGVSLTSSFVVSSTPQTNLSSISSATNTLTAHEGMYAVGVSTANPSLLRATGVAPGTGNEFGAFNLTQTTSLTGTSAIVLAPEPGTMAALGAGALFLVRKRRKARK